MLATSVSYTIDSVISNSNNCACTYNYFVKLANGSTDLTVFGGSLSALVPPVLSIYATSSTQLGNYSL